MKNKHCNTSSYSRNKYSCRSKTLVLALTYCIRKIIKTSDATENILEELSNKLVQERGESNIEQDYRPQQTQLEERLLKHPKR